MLAASETAKRGPKKSASSKRDRAKNGKSDRRRNATPGPSLQDYFDDAVKSATTAAKGIFDRDDFEDELDDGTDFSDEISFATPMENTYTDRSGKSRARDRSMEVAAVSTEAERKKLQQQQADIATFRLKKNGRPRVVRNLVKQLKKDEEKYQKAARALQEAEENMWKTKWRLYNLAEDFGLLCGNFGASVVEDEEEVNEMVVHDKIYDDGDYDDYSYAHSEYSYDR